MTEAKIGINGSWEVVTLLTGEGPAQVIEGTHLTLEIADDGSVAGFSGCNRFFGRLSESGGIGPLGSTLMAGPPDVMAQEGMYLSLLARADSLFADLSGLEVREGREVLMVLVPSNRDFREVPWRLTGMHNGADGFSSVLGDVVITAFFDNQNRVSGNSGCNRYTATYSLADGGMVIGSAVGTRMMCPDPVGMEQESRYLEWLPRVASHGLSVGFSGRTLDLYESEGMRALQFVEEG